MPGPFTDSLSRVQRGESLDRLSMTAAMTLIMSGAVIDEELIAFLAALADKGETAEEVAGAATVMREHMTPIRSHHPRLLDTCGTGGGGSDLFNISTTAAIVIAAAGEPVAKHGNRSITSRSGSADLLAELGVNIDADASQIERCLRELGICFCFAQRMHPAMRHVASARKKLGRRTIFNILGPLANPAGATYQLLGAGRPELRPLLAESLKLLSTERAFVLSGEDGLGEATIAGSTHVTVVEGDNVAEIKFRPQQFGLSTNKLDSLRVVDAASSAMLVRRVLAGEQGVPRDIVVLNAALGLLVCDPAVKPIDAAARAAAAIDSGAAAQLLDQLAVLSHAAPA